MEVLVSITNIIEENHTFTASYGIIPVAQAKGDRVDVGKVHTIKCMHINLDD
jgi:hypothetical protein